MLGITVLVAAISVWGVSGLKKGYELEKSLPADSYTRAFLQSQRLYFSAEGPGIQTFCGKIIIVHINAHIQQTLNATQCPPS